MAQYDSIPPTTAASHMLAQYAKKAGFCAAVGVAFGAGLLVAKMEKTEVKTSSGDLLELAEQRDDKYQRVREQLALRYHDELVESTEEVDRHRLVKTPKAPKAKAPKKTPEATPTPVEPAAKPAQKNSPSQGPAEVALRTEEKRVEIRKESAHVDKKPTVTALASSEDAENDANKDKIAKAFLDVMGNDAPAIVKKDVIPKQKEAPQKTTRFTVQLGSFPSMSSAKAMATSFKRKGYSAVVREGIASGRATFRVHVGSFSSRDDAIQKRKMIEKNEGILTLVTGI